MKQHIIVVLGIENERDKNTNTNAKILFSVL